MNNEQRIRSICSQLEMMCVQESGYRNITGGPKSLTQEAWHGCTGEQLMQSAMSLSEANCVGILVGSSTQPHHVPCIDTDGFSGALTLAGILVQLQKQVVFIGDQTTIEQVRRCTSYIAVLNNSQRVEYIQVQARNTSDSSSKLGPVLQRLQHVVNVGRIGPNCQQKWVNQDGKDVSHHEPHFESLFQYSPQTSQYHYHTTCIGEYGNELGMGRVSELVSRFNPGGSNVSCQLKSDYTIVSTVVDWGAIALSAALCVVSKCNTKYQDTNMDNNWPKTSDYESIMRSLVSNKFRDGTTGSLSETVDGIPFAQCSQMRERMINKMQEMKSQLTPGESCGVVPSLKNSTRLTQPTSSPNELAA